MARITVEDCIDKLPSRFELVLVASNRARKLHSGESPTIEKDNDKNTVIALREIADETIPIEEMKKSLVEEYQTVSLSEEEEELSLENSELEEDNNINSEEENDNPEEENNNPEEENNNPDEENNNPDEVKDNSDEEIQNLVYNEESEVNYSSDINEIDSENNNSN